MRLVAGIALLLAALLAYTGDAHAHASLIDSTPGDGAMLSDTPATLRLTFNEPVTPITLRLIEPSGRFVLLGAVGNENNTVTIGVPPMTERGSYLLSWRVVSADGHPVGGIVRFAFGEASDGAPAAVPQPDRAAQAALWLARIAIYAALMLGIGGAVFCAWIDRRPAAAGVRRMIVVLAGLGLVAVVLSVGLQGADALAVPLAHLASAAVWTTGIRTTYGVTAVVAGVALCVGLVVVLGRSLAGSRALSLVALLGVGAALAASGHASAASPQWLMRPAVLVHAVTVALWAGSLVPLAASLRAGRDDALVRFSAAIPWVLVLLLASGLCLAVVQIEHVDALWSTGYGKVFLAKCAALVALFALVCVNRFRLTPRIRAGSPAARSRLVGTIAAEVVLVLAIFAIVATWRFTPPPRTLPSAETVYIHFHGERAMAQIDVTPQRRGGAHVALQVTDGALKPVDAKEVAIVLSNRAAGIEAMRSAAVKTGDGEWRIDDIRIPVPGIWRLRVEILISDFDKVMLEDGVELPRAP